MDRNTNNTSLDGLAPSKTGTLLLSTGIDSPVLRNHCKKRTSGNCRTIFDQKKALKISPRNRLAILSKGDASKRLCVPESFEKRDQSSISGGDRTCNLQKVDTVEPENSEVSMTVKVSVYCKSNLPYVVVQDENSKFAAPHAYLKLRNCRVLPLSQVGGSSDDDIDEDRKFRIFTNIYGDAFTFEARDRFVRDEWVKFLQPLTRKESAFFNRGLQTITTKLPVLTEEDESDEDSYIETGKSQTSSPSRMARDCRKISLPSADMIPRIRIQTCS